MTVDETKMLLARIAEFWPGRSATITAATVDAWSHLFADSSFDAVLAALDSYCDDETMNQHPPAGPVLRSRANKLTPTKYPTIWDNDQGGFYVEPARREQLEAARRKAIEA
jgi:hypothetical protein